MASQSDTEKAKRVFDDYLRHGSRESLAHVVQLYYRHVWSVAVRFTGHHDDALDICQDVFLSLLVRPPAVGTVSSPRGYLASRVVTLARRRRQAAQRRELRERNAAKKVLVDAGVQATEVNGLQEAIEQLPERIRTAFELRYLAGFRNREIAQCLGYSERSVEADLKHARDILRSRLGKGVLGVVASVCAAQHATPHPPPNLLPDLLRIVDLGTALSPPSAAVVKEVLVEKTALAVSAVVAVVAVGVFLHLSSSTDKPEIVQITPEATGAKRGEDDSIARSSEQAKPAPSRSVSADKPSPRGKKSQTRSPRAQRRPEHRLVGRAPPVVTPVMWEDFGEAAHDMVMEALSADFHEEHEEAASLYRAFIEDNLLAPESPILASYLGLMYSKLGKGLEAKLWLTVAKDLVGDHPLADTFELNLAHVEAQCGELDSAKKRLRRLGEMEVPTSLDDPWTGLPPLFVARSRLAKICELQGQPEEADALLRSVAEDAAVLARENPGDSFMSSYAVRAYYERIQLARRSANTIAEAERAAVKLLESVPGDFRREVEERLELDSSVIGHSR